MIQIIKQGYIKPQYVTECTRCQTKFTFNDDDTEYVNVMHGTELYIRCPYCGRELYEHHWNKVKEAE